MRAKSWKLWNRRSRDNSLRRAASIASIAVLIAASWLVLNIAFQYSGNPTGPFYTGAKTPLPQALAGGHTFRVHDDVGYDAQFYHLIAHDPRNRRGFLSYVDNPRLRWRRIGVPGLAALLAAGDDRGVDYVYIAIELAFVFLGTLWLSWYVRSKSLHPAWGLTFLLIPAVAVSLDRLTIDLPLAAICIGLALYAEAPEPGWQVYAMLGAAPLIRETGMIVVLGWCVYRIVMRDARGAVLGAVSAAPVVAWWGYVQMNTRPDGTDWLSSYPFSGIINRTLQGTGDPTSTPWLRAANVFENLALAGMWMALVLAFYLAWQRRWRFIEITVILFAAFEAVLGRFDLWSSAYATGRTMAPLLILLALLAFQNRRVPYALPLVLFLPRIALQYEAELKLMLHGVR
jgi:hypothetical protein